MFGKKKEKQEKKHKKKRQKEEYQELRGLLGVGKDYHVYHMKRRDYLAAWGIGFAGGLVVMFAFFNNALIALIGGIVCAKFLPKYYREYRKKKQTEELRNQFKDLLESLTSSYSAGQNTVEAFSDAYSDMVSIYGEGADIVTEVQIICTGLKNNINIEELLLDFAKRSGLDDAMSFANVFEVCNRQGGDLKRIVSETREIINDKIEIEMEIETMLSGSKNELNIMMVMPVIIVVMLKGLGTTMAGTNTPATVLIKIVCIGIFGLAYVMGRKITDIKI
ncbi:hypothetical protein Lac2_28940 [Claveliimonas bilis]|uniref:type II secretion system F family protein n=1 Tax=Claveliimonas bilis TaxID=3028070 RepID=UPI00292E0598|nr:kinase [Claveliimonas bilis]BDZ84760.1 hypothetical protein Lac2_28940 [Claveliimonas bilis]